MTDVITNTSHLWYMNSLIIKILDEDSGTKREV